MKNEDYSQDVRALLRKVRPRHIYLVTGFLTTTKSTWKIDGSQKRATEVIAKEKILRINTILEQTLRRHLKRFQRRGRSWLLRLGVRMNVTMMFSPGWVGRKHLTLLVASEDLGLIKGLVGMVNSVAIFIWMRISILLGYVLTVSSLGIDLKREWTRVSHKPTPWFDVHVSKTSCNHN